MTIPADSEHFTLVADTTTPKTLTASEDIQRVIVTSSGAASMFWAIDTDDITTNPRGWLPADVSSRTVELHGLQREVTVTCRSAGTPEVHIEIEV